MPGEGKERMTYTKKEIQKAIKTLQSGSSNKWKYVEAKDMLVSLAQEYAGGSLIFKDPKKEEKLKDRKAYQKPKYHK
jgi:hypothetical protein